ncbi:MAG TPA: DUF1385 domain-containing protein [Solirubrobacteraceae bacterium]|jgi:uncharacterized protein YqhQ|nr:DUF1385 domain-containing protein [Solirubrobacteraceae bacterium]
MATAVAPEQTAAGGVGTAADTGPGATADGQLVAQRDAPLGGQAVLEGVMMRGVAHWAVAVRKPVAPDVAATSANGAVADNGASPNGSHPAATNGLNPAEEPLGEIEVTTQPLSSPLRRHRILRLPIVRGVVALGESLAIGFRALSVSANAQLPPAPAGDGAGAGDGADGKREEEGDEEEQAIPAAVWAGTVVVSVVFAIGLFFLIPVGITSLIKGDLGDNSVLFWLVEGLIRTGIFLGYMLALSRLKDLRRVFEYHGAEHKTISCYEAQLELTPTNAQRFSRLHPRCGTSFLLVVMIVAIFIFAPLGLPAWYWLVATRILGVPIIAGISFEIIKYAGRHRTRGWVRALMWPGLKLQLLTTREPDLHQLAVAIAALEAVLAHETPGELSAADLVGVEVVA